MLEKVKEFIFNSENYIDLILLDIYMQQENGLDLLFVLYSVGCKSDVIVIFFVVDVVIIKDLFYYGVVDYLIKFFQVMCFEEVLIGWLCKKMVMEKCQYYEQFEFDLFIYGNLFSEQEFCWLLKGLIQ